jgi:hypothetical protein
VEIPGKGGLIAVLDADAIRLPPTIRQFTRRLKICVGSIEPADPTRRAAGHPAHAVRAMEGAGSGARYRGREDRRAGDHGASTEKNYSDL